VISRLVQKVGREEEVAVHLLATMQHIISQAIKHHIMTMGLPLP
jgi:hypothetical protein